MYFNPFYLGFFLGTVSALALIFLVLLIVAVRSVNEEKKK